jgi:NAD(P)-dependent dehydrogenase (short-subunit alcohol dehydrogenase family)
MAELRFDDRVAIVTGAGRGIGRAHALALAGRGAKVVVNDLGGALAGDGDDPGPAAAVAREIEALGGEAVADTSDVASEAGAAAIVDAALGRWGRVDVVVNNAGNLAPDDIPGLTVEALARHLDVHVIGSYNVTRAAWPAMVEASYGRVVMTASIGLFGGPSLIAYSTAKGGVMSLGRSLAAAGEGHGIRVNLLLPAATTRMVTDPDFRVKANLPPLAAGDEPDPRRGPEQIAPMLLVLAHETCPVNGEMLEAAFGRFARAYLAETRGLVEPGITPEALLARWDEVVDDAGRATPGSTKEAIAFREAVLGAVARA